MAALWVLSFWKSSGIAVQRGWSDDSHVTTQQLIVGIDSRQVGFDWMSLRDVRTEWNAPQRPWWNFDPGIGEPEPFRVLANLNAPTWYRLGFEFEKESANDPDGINVKIAVPSWFPLLLLVTLTFIAPLLFRAWRARARRALLSRALCPTCGYDLRGAAHERCPECGESVSGRSPSTASV
jgi:hypothetical protein